MNIIIENLRHNEIWGNKTNIDRITRNLRQNKKWGNKTNINRIIKNLGLKLHKHRKLETKYVSCQQHISTEQ